MPQRDQQGPRLRDTAWLDEPRLRELLAVLNAGEAQTRIAGGAVRNAILGEEIADIDLATTLLPDQVAERSKAAGFGAHPTGIEHGTVTIVVRGKPFEVTTLRRDVSTDGRRATVAHTTDWEEDALRRDFTMNAMYCDQSGKIYDFTDGYRDCVNRCVRFVGKPSKRILEDFLRILRFFRFNAIYGRGEMDAASLYSATRLRRGLLSLSAERIRQELMKLLAAPRAVETLKVMVEKRIVGFILPYEKEWRVLERLPADPLLRLFVLAAEPQGLQERLRLSNSEAKRLAAMAEAPDVTPDFREPERRKLLYALGPEAFRDAVHLTWARGKAKPDDKDWRKLAALPETWPIPKFPVSGSDLKALGLAPGPAMGETLRKLEDWWIASDFKPAREDLLARVKQQGNHNA